MPNGSISLLSRATGLARDDIESIAAAAKANAQRLRDCPGHDFRPIDATRLMPRHRCAVCGGEVDASAAHWYAQGRAHAARS